MKNYYVLFAKEKDKKNAPWRICSYHYYSSNESIEKIYPYDVVNIRNITVLRILALPKKEWERLLSEEKKIRSSRNTDFFKYELVPIKLAW